VLVIDFLRGFGETATGAPAASRAFNAAMKHNINCASDAARACACGFRRTVYPVPDDVDYRRAG
jgi:hypothetical protein